MAHIFSVHTIYIEMYSTVCTGVQNDCFDPSRVIEGREPLEAGELRPPAGRDRWTDDGYRVGLSTIVTQNNTGVFTGLRSITRIPLLSLERFVIWITPIWITFG
jgi:hypothetical protein